MAAKSLPNQLPALIPAMLSGSWTPHYKNRLGYQTLALLERSGTRGSWPREMPYDEQLSITKPLPSGAFFQSSRPG